MEFIKKNIHMNRIKSNIFTQITLEDDLSICINIQNTWKNGIPLVKVNGSWKRGLAWVKQNGVWKRGGA